MWIIVYIESHQPLNMYLNLNNYVYTVFHEKIFIYPPKLYSNYSFPAADLFCFIPTLFVNNISSPFSLDWAFIAGLSRAKLRRKRE